MRMKYICSTCDAEFDSAEECEKHEKSYHVVGELDAVIYDRGEKWPIAIYIKSNNMPPTSRGKLYIRTDYADRKDVISQRESDGYVRKVGGI